MAKAAQELEGQMARAVADKQKGGDFQVMAMQKGPIKAARKGKRQSGKGRR